MEIDLLLKIAGIGILVSVINQILNKAGREEQGMLVTIAGLVIVLMMVVKEIDTLFQTVKTVFKL